MKYCLGERVWFIRDTSQGPLCGGGYIQTATTNISSEPLYVIKTHYSSSRIEVSESEVYSEANVDKFMIEVENKIRTVIV